MHHSLRKYGRFYSAAFSNYFVNPYSAMAPASRNPSRLFGGRTTREARRPPRANRGDGGTRRLYGYLVPLSCSFDCLRQLDQDIWLVPDNPSVVTRFHDSDITRPELHFGSVIHSNALRSRKKDPYVVLLTTLPTKHRLDVRRPLPPRLQGFSVDGEPPTVTTSILPFSNGVFVSSGVAKFFPSIFGMSPRPFVAKSA